MLEAYKPFLEILVWNSLLFITRTKNEKDESIQTKSTSHGRQHGSSEVLITQLTDLESFGDLTTSLTEAKARIQELSQTTVEADQEKASLSWSGGLKIWLLKHRHCKPLSPERRWDISSRRSQPSRRGTASTLVSCLEQK
jgi:hypothetical protein